MTSTYYIKEVKMRSLENYNCLDNTGNWLIILFDQLHSSIHPWTCMSQTLHITAYKFIVLQQMMVSLKTSVNTSFVLCCLYTHVTPYEKIIFRCKTGTTPHFFPDMPPTCTFLGCSWGQPTNLNFSRHQQPTNSNFSRHQPPTN